MSTPADLGLRLLRRRAHVLLARIFGDTPKEEDNSHTWLGMNTREGHIGLMDRPAVRRLIARLELLQRRQVRPLIPPRRVARRPEWRSA